MSRPCSRRPDPSSQGMTLQRDGSRRPDPSSQGTTLQRDGPRRPGTRLERDQATNSSGTKSRTSYQAPTAAPAWGKLTDSQTTLQNRDSSSSRAQPSMAHQSSHQSSSTHSSTRPPPGSTSGRQGSTLVTKLDRDMASRQTKIDVLPEKERKKQEEWATQQLSQNSGNCPAGFNWTRIIGGYQCDGGSHFVSDALLQEGMRGFIQGFQSGECSYPIYKDEYGVPHMGSPNGPVWSIDSAQNGAYPGGLAAVFPKAGRLPGVSPRLRRQGWTATPDGRLVTPDGVAGRPLGYLGGFRMGLGGGFGGGRGMFHHHHHGGGHGGHGGGHQGHRF